MTFKKINFLPLIFLVFTQFTLGQISTSEYVGTTDDVLQLIKFNKVDDALDSFAVSSKASRNELTKAYLRTKELNSSIKVKRVLSHTKNYIIDRCIYNNENDRVQLMLNFYYKKDMVNMLIEKIEVKDRYYFESLPKNNSINSGGLNSGVPPSTEGLNN